MVAVDGGSGGGGDETAARKPYNEVEQLQLFGQVVDAVGKRSRPGEVKLENVMLAGGEDGPGKNVGV
jgi:hypothetical protein